MANNFVFKDSLPVAPLKIAALESCKNLAAKVNDHIVQFRRNDIEELMRRKEDLHYRGYDVDSYLLHCSCPRFGTGEGKAVINESVRGTDVFVMVDVMNYSIPYTVSGYTNHMSPDDHFQDLKRIIGACSATAHRVNVVMPFLYESRQHKRSKRESLDCAMALEELAALGVENIITFDAHDPRVQNAIPLIGFDNFMPTYQFVKALFSHDSNIRIDKEHLMVISPDEGAMQRNMYYSSVLGVNLGMFYKRRDYSRVVNGRNPIVAHEYLGESVEGKDVFVADDIISSGESMLDIAFALKKQGARRIFANATYAIFTNGLAAFDEAVEQGVLNGVFGTNLTYLTPELKSRAWFHEVDVSKYIAYYIAAVNHDISVSAIIDPHEKIRALLDKTYGQQ